MYFHTIHEPIRNKRKKELDAWKKSVNDQLEQIYRELKRTLRHLDIGSSTFLHNKVNDGDSEGDVHQVPFSLIICR